MYKVFNISKYILYLITLVLMLLLNINNGMETKMLLLYILFIILLIINIRDIKYKRKCSHRYNVLYCIVMTVTIFLLCRAMFDTSLISNNKIYMDLLQDINKKIGLSINYNYISLNYFFQNIYYLIMIYICLIFYKLIEIKEKINYKYSNLSIICLIVNFILSFKTISLFTQTFDINRFPLLFFATNTILLIVEISSLVKNNKIKKEWLIYLSFLFNIFAYISIFT